MAAMDLLERVRSTIDAHRLLARAGTVVVAVSGGPDSLCLLDLLRRLQGDYEVRLHVAHLNHGLRAEAQAEAAFVAGLAGRWGLPCTVGRADVPQLARAEHRSIEEAARVARYRFLAQVAMEQGAETVAVGHNADDQVETVLMHCLRGAGLAGLRGMRRRARWPEVAEGACPPPTLIRPLLDVPRAHVEAYCQERGLEPLRDRTNVEMTFFRNRIRHELIPALETYNPRIRERLRHTADVLADDYDYLQQCLDGLWPQLVLRQAPSGIALRADLYRALGPSPQRGALRRGIRTLRRSLRDVGWVHLEQARQAALHAPTGSTVTLPAGLVFEVGYDRLVLRPAEQVAIEPTAVAMDAPERPLAVPGCTPLAEGGWALEARLADQPPPPEEGPQPDRRSICLDAERAGSDLRLRTRRPGDRFQPRGLGGQHKSVKDYMIDAKVPRAERGRVPLLVSERGILWIVGWRASELASPGPGTRRYLCLRLVPPPGPPGGPCGAS